MPVVSGGSKVLATDNFARFAAARRSTRLAFAAAGFGVACWAPLVPYAKERLGINEATLGLLLLCLGAGSVTTMPATGGWNVKFGSRPVIVASGIALALVLPLLAVWSSVLPMAVTLFAFGAALGSLDVAMNVQAVEVERKTGQPLLSGFHALFSLGGFSGSILITLLLSRHVSPLTSAFVGAVIVSLSITIASTSLTDTRVGDGEPLFALPQGIVLVLAILACIVFLIEGALLDWSALLLVTSQLVSVAHGGLGYTLFAIAMTVGRLAGDRIVRHFGDHRTLLVGSAISLAGFVVVLLSKSAPIALAGFVFIGLGAANLVPILFRRAAAQRQMPSGLAVASVTTAGYAGMLAGPALIGFVAHLLTIRSAFALLALLSAAFMILSGIFTKPQQQK